MNVNRYDKILGPLWMSSKFEPTPEKFLKGRAVICTTGVYVYEKDGKISRELRLPEEVFKKDFLDSLKLKPLTLGHPSEMINADNVKQYQVGNLGDNPSSPEKWGTDGTDNYHVSIDMIVHDAAAIKEVMNGTRALSVGYTCDLEQADENARWCGIQYDYIQRNLKANHVAIVDEARAGDAAKIRLDSATGINLNLIKEAQMDKSITLDGVEYKAEAQVIATLTKEREHANTLQAEVTKITGLLETAKADASKITGERDTLKAQVETLTEENKKLKETSVDQKKIDVMVSAKLRIRKFAEDCGVEVKEDQSELDIMKSVILNKYPKFKFDGKDENYIRASFDAVVQIVGEVEEVETDGKVRSLKKDSDHLEEDTAENHREKMLKRLRKDSRPKEDEDEDEGGTK